MRWHVCSPPHTCTHTHTHAQSSFKSESGRKPRTKCRVLIHVSCGSPVAVMSGNLCRVCKKINKNGGHHRANKHPFEKPGHGAAEGGKKNWLQASRTSCFSSSSASPPSLLPAFFFLFGFVLSPSQLWPATSECL